jgi:hypothetical protein
MTYKRRALWLSIVLAGLLAFILSLAVTTATVAGYAMTLAIKAKGQPNPNQIAAFANHYMPFLGGVALSLLVIIAARWVVRRAKSQRPLYGVLVGVVAALPTVMFIRRPDLREVISLLVPPLVGWLGGLWGARAVKNDDLSRIVAAS